MEDQARRKGRAIHLVTSPDSPEFAHLSWALTRSSVVALDAEWKPVRTRHQDQPSSSSSCFPTVTLLQLACRLGPPRCSDSADDSFVFLLDLLAIPLLSVYGILRDLFTSPDVLKLGFKFKQDLIYLSSTFSSQRCDHCFDRVRFF